MLARQTGPNSAARASAPCKKKTSATAAPRAARSHPAELAWASLELAALEYRARRGEIILLYEDETVLWCFALPRRVGGAKPSARACLPGH